jgi:hypothetical protein
MDLLVLQSEIEKNKSSDMTSTSVILKEPCHWLIRYIRLNNLMRSNSIHESQKAIAHPNDAFSRAKPAFKEKHVAVSGGFTFFKCSVMHSCCIVVICNHECMNISILKYAYFKSCSHSYMFFFNCDFCSNFVIRVWKVVVAVLEVKSESLSK